MKGIYTAPLREAWLIWVNTGRAASGLGVSDCHSLGNNRHVGPHREGHGRVSLISGRNRWARSRRQTRRYQGNPPTGWHLPTTPKSPAPPGSGRTHTCADTHANTCTHVRMHAHIHMCSHVHTQHAHTCMCTHNITGVRIQSRQSISQLWVEADPLSVDTMNRPCFSAGPSHLRKSRPSPHTSPCHAALSTSALWYHSRLELSCHVLILICLCGSSRYSEVLEKRNGSYSALYDAL